MLKDDVLHRRLRAIGFHLPDGVVVRIRRE
jgi:hypothetical protein